MHTGSKTLLELHCIDENSNIDHSVETLSKILTDIFEEFTKTNVEYKNIVMCAQIKS